MNKVLKIICVSLGAAGLLVLFAFVGSIRSTAICEGVEVGFTRASGHELVTEADIRRRVLDFSGGVVGIPLNKIDTRALESSLEDICHVREVRVYKTIDKQMVIEVEEREPIVRLLDKNGTAALMDIEGFVMPLSANATLRLPVISGSFELSDVAHGKLMNCNDTTIGMALGEIYSYAMAITSDPFWIAQLQQTNLQADGDFVAYPQVGMNTINFGNTEQINSKLKRLRIFYDEGLDSENWNKYGIINLKYKDQIVCTKK